MQLVAYPSVNISADNNFAFRHACLNGHLEVVKWLVEIHPSTKYDNKGFVYACWYAHLEVAKWLVVINPSAEYFYDCCYDSAFVNACSRGYLEVAKWLVDIKPSAEYLSACCYNSAFIDACSNNHLEVAKWLINTYPQLNIFANNNEAFRNACIYKHIEVARWLVEICPYHYMIELDQSQNQILGWRIRLIQEIKWLERAVPILSYNSKTPNIFHSLNYDTVRRICEFV